MLAPFSLLFLLIALVNSQNLSYDQTAILLSLKQHWGNPPSLGSWNSTSSPCDWPEVECDSAGTAIILRLGDKNLKGTIPSAICQLKNLVSIDLQMNKLLGRIPSCLDNCSNLENLELSMNEVSGTIPSAICQLRKLTRIMLGMNKLSGHIPSCLDNCSNLETLDLSTNELSGTIPSAICQLKNLVSIELSENKLWGPIPSCLDNCSNLEYLELSMNELSGTIPSAICQLKNLVLIDLRMNKLSGPIPSCLDNCSNLEYLDLSINKLSGTIPSAICQLRNLTLINLGMNKLSGHIPACLYICSYLDTLDLSVNELSGTIPGELFLMQKLQYLIISSNRLFGGIPTPIQAYGLQYLDLSDNNLNGSIPYHDIRYLSNLTYLNLSINSFTGSIPWGLFHLDQLFSLSLAHNNLAGELPAHLGRLFRLRELNLSHNHLYGIIPERFVNFKLSSLDLSYNQLSGGIVQSLCRLISNPIAIFRLCSNKFFGKISSEFVNGAFAESCLDPSNICSCNKNESLPDCPCNLCSADSNFRSLLNCNNIESDSNSTRTKTTRTMATIKIIAEAIGCGVVGFVIFGYIARKCWKMACATIASTRNIIFPSTFPLNKDKEWEMISFQKLDFDKSDILSSLTDENLIGNGGSGKVYRVVTNESGNTVAVKSIWNDKKSDERLEKEFMAEIQTLGTIRHNNIVKLMCYISGKNTQLLVYQYFENQSLDQWLHDNKREISPIDHCSITKLDWPMRLNIAVGVAQGLCYMHHHCSPPIIHRDIKSSNILLDSEFNAKIADFGMAKMLIRNADPETASAVVGTFGYIAHEYAYTKRVNVKSDVYSFGVVLLELTTGRKAVRPDDHMNLAGWAQIHYRETAYVVDSLDDEIKESSLLDQIVAVFRLGVMCTTKTPANRPSMRDCLNILQDYSSCCSSSDSMS